MKRKKKKEKMLKIIENSNFYLDINLKDLYKNSNIELEELNFIRTFGKIWYKYPKGHIYTVGDY